MARYLRLALAFILGHTVSYLIVGAIAYPLFSKPFWEGPNPLYAPFVRTMAEPALWEQAMAWQIPGQLLRGLLMAFVFIPLLPKLEEISLTRRYAFVAGLLFVFAHLAASAPSPGNIEGALYMRPEFVTVGFWPSQPEMIAYSLFGGFLIARFMVKSVKRAPASLIADRARVVSDARTAV